MLTASTKIIDVTGDTPSRIEGRVPARSVVIPGSYTKQFPAGEFQVPCASQLSVKEKNLQINKILNEALKRK